MIERALRGKRRTEKIFERKEDGTIVWRWSNELPTDYDWPYYGNVLKPGETGLKGIKVAEKVEKSWLAGHISPDLDEDDE